MSKDPNRCSVLAEEGAGEAVVVGLEAVPDGGRDGGGRPLAHAPARLQHLAEGKDKGLGCSEAREADGDINC